MVISQHSLLCSKYLGERAGIQVPSGIPKIGDIIRSSYLTEPRVLTERVWGPQRRALSTAHGGGFQQPGHRAVACPGAEARGVSPWAAFTLRQRLGLLHLDASCLCQALGRTLWASARPASLPASSWARPRIEEVPQDLCTSGHPSSTRTRASLANTPSFKSLTSFVSMSIHVSFLSPSSETVKWKL